jgi:hypothetical protein
MQLVLALVAAVMLRAPVSRTVPQPLRMLGSSSARGAGAPRSATREPRGHVRHLPLPLPRLAGQGRTYAAWSESSFFRILNPQPLAYRVDPAEWLRILVENRILVLSLAFLLLALALQRMGRRERLL